MSIVRKEKFIFVESSENHNKFWYIEEHDNGMIRTRWGRVGNKETSSEKQFGSNASKEYDKLVKSKLKKGYTQLNTIDSEISSLKNTGLSKYTLESLALAEIDFDKSNNTIKEMIKVFCAENIHNITANTSITYNSDANVFQTPCGIVTAVAIIDAKAILADIKELVADGDYFNSDFTKKTEEYCKIIPQKIKGRFDARKIFNGMRDIQVQESVLESLSDSLKLIEALNNKNAGKKTKNEKLFNASIVEVTSTRVINKIKKMYAATHQNIHSCRSLKVKRVFEIKIDKMEEEFQKTKTNWMNKNKTCNEMELWHGTKKTNLISILKNGFVVPPANAKHVVGRMFGNGVYLSDQSTKALNYSYGWWSGSRDKNCYMFLCDVLMGKSYTPRSSCSYKPAGYDSIFAKANYSGVQNNEMIVDTNQVNPKYLVEFAE